MRDPYPLLRSLLFQLPPEVAQLPAEFRAMRDEAV